MKKGLTLAGMALVLALTITAPLSAQTVPNLINFQAYLTDSAGTPLDGTNSVIFTIYSATEGGTNLWSETQSVTVTKGVANVLLGSVNPLVNTTTSPETNLFLEEYRYLGVRVGGDPEMVPRKRIVSVGYAHNAQNLGGNPGDQDRFGTCPSDMLDMGCYCIDKDEYTTQGTWTYAASACQSERKRLCSFSEWYAACAANPTGLLNMTGNWEWLDEFNDDYQGAYINAVVVGVPDCSGYSDDTGSHTSSTYPFRCCK